MGAEIAIRSTFFPAVDEERGNCFFCGVHFVMFQSTIKIYDIYELQNFLENNKYDEQLNHKRDIDK